MKTELIQIGNSRGSRSPKRLIEQCGLGEAVDLRVENDCLVISPGRRPRNHWKEAFQAAGNAIHDELLLNDASPSEFDSKQWRW